MLLLKLLILMCSWPVVVSILDIQSTVVCSVCMIFFKPRNAQIMRDLREIEAKIHLA